MAGGMSFLKIISLTSAACFAIVLGYKFVTAGPPGYCSVQGRYISDEEFIKASAKVIKWSDEENERYLEQQRMDSPDTYEEKYQGYVSQLMERPKAYQLRKQNQNNLDLYRVNRYEIDTVFRWLFDFQRVRVTIGPLSLSYDVCGTLLGSKPHIMKPGLLNTTEILTQELPSRYLKGKQ